MLYAIIHGIGKIILKIYFHFIYEGVENLPSNSGFIVAPNHRSALDIPIVGAALPKKMYSMGKKELFRNRFIGTFLRALGGFPIDRQKPDLKALKHACNIVKNGFALLMFPEGTRSEEGILQEIKKGIIYVSTLAKVPIVPTGIVGTERAFRKGSKFPKPEKVSLFFGNAFFPWKLFDPNSDNYYDKATKFLREEIAKCIKKAEEL